MKAREDRGRALNARAYNAREIADIFEDIQLRLMASLRRSLGRHKAAEEKEGFQWPAWQAEKLRELERYRRERAAIMEEARPAIDAEVARLLEEEYADGFSGGLEDGLSGVNRARIDSLAAEASGKLHRAEESALRMMDDVYRRAIYRAEMAAAAGAATMEQAVDMAVRDFLAAGIRCIEYRDGRRVDIAAYAEMAVRTASLRSYLQGEADRRAALGIETVLVSQYGACSETCLPWQGRVYIDDVWGTFEGERDGRGRGKSRTGTWYPLLSTAVAGGLFHPNCRHTLTAWIEGTSQRPEPLDGAQVRETARLEQKQRRMEANVRRWKRLAGGTMEPRKAQEYRRHLQAAQKDLRGFLEAHGDRLRRDYWREKVHGDPAGDGASADDGLLLAPQPVKAYIRQDGSFDLEAALEEYGKFLQTLSGKSRMYLQQSFDNVGFEQIDHPKIVFAYDGETDMVLYNPSHPDFAKYDFRVTITHEFGHRIDHHFVGASSDAAFTRAIENGERVVLEHAQDFVAYCDEEDSDGFLSDILSGICKDEVRFPCWHEKKYWAKAKTRQKDAFANLFAIDTYQDREKLDFLQEYFPDLLKAYQGLFRE